MIEVVKGGLILDLGVRGFLPASLVDIRRVQDLDEFLGQELRCKVIELNRSRNNVVLSRRAVLEEERKEQRQQILDRLQPGDVVEGQISNIVDFGAFVDLDGMDGLIHISELSWSHVNHPSEVLEIGQTVKVKVLDIDRDRQRISLGLKQTQSDPWQQVLESYHEGDVVEGRVTKVVTFGAFVEILPGVEGLVHISELAQHHVENPREVVSQGHAVNVKIIEVDGERRRLSLSLKRVEDGERRAAARRRRRVGPPAPTIDLSEEVFAESAAPRGRGRRAAAEAKRPSTSRATSRRRGRAGGGRRRGRASGRGPRPAEPRADEAAPEARRTSAEAVPRSRRARSVQPQAWPPVAVAITGGIGAGKSEALRAFARHGAATVSSDEIVHHLLRATRCRRRSSSAWATDRRAGRRGRPRRARRRRLRRPRRARLARGAAAPARRRREYLHWRDELAAAPSRRRRRHRGAAALRDRRRGALRQGRRDHRAARAAARALARSRPTTASSGSSPTTEKVAARRLRVREHRLARGARRVRRGASMDEL